ncbi:unnamed protein product [Protopolystoma xenopodis]|uniref:Ig-like domain-containing protein n=1 Tax=Protopolystoma xenopodis TaxID=117903 RepID=A0A448WFS3_9PLAT|nr:unnamed protein product [Protopolystoma xenopodis]
MEPRRLKCRDRAANWTALRGSCDSYIGRLTTGGFHLRSRTWKTFLNSQEFAATRTLVSLIKQRSGIGYRFVAHYLHGLSLRLYLLLILFCYSIIAHFLFSCPSPPWLGSRFNTVFDRGYACLDIVYTFPEDSGIYSCVVSNQLGSVASNPAVVE